MSGLTFKFELTKEGIAKLNATRNIPKAQKYQLTQWLTLAKYDATRAANAMQKSGGKKKGGSAMGRNIGMHVSPGYENIIGEVGTGIGNTQTVKYAHIQDQGGTTHPTVTDKLRRWAWAMFYGTKDDKFKWIALTKKQKLDVNIPASSWFTNVMIGNQSMLDDMMSPSEVLKVAEKMGAK